MNPVAERHRRMQRPADTPAAPLPRLLLGARRRLFLLLIGTGTAGACVAGTMAWALTLLLGEEDPGIRTAAVFALLAGACGTGGLRLAERVLAEKLGQDYVNDIRTGLLEASLTGAKAPAIGITIARITNDLSSVRNWVTMGLAPLLVAVPLLLGTALALSFISGVLALAVAVPLGLLSVLLALLARPAYSRARALRRKRGQLAAHVADTLSASPLIRAAGGEQREIRRIRRLGAAVGAAAVARAAISGSLRGSAAAAAAFAAVAVAASSVWFGLDTVTIAAGLTVVGLISGPVTGLGRVVEYRESFRAAGRILGRALADAQKPRPEEPSPRGPRPQVPTGPTGHEGNSLDSGLCDATVCIGRIELGTGVGIPGIRLAAGQRIVVESSDPGRITELFEALLGLRTDARADVWILGRHLGSSSSRQRRELVGYAAGGAALERGTIARAVSYRRPELSGEAVTLALARVGLDQVVERLHAAGENTSLRRGGAPLTVSERARLQLARSMLGEPPLLLLNHIDADLDAEGFRMLAEALRNYPGAAVIASNRARLLVPDHLRWDIDHPEPGTP